MSEFQVVEFRAIDRPLTDEQMEFMDRQSSRAEFSKWAYSVEYHYSSFRGDINGMLRNGYDIFVMDSNFGQRELRLRLPMGLPFSGGVISSYMKSEGLSWTKDKDGVGGILSIAPALEDVSYLEMEFDDLFEAATVLREMFASGDLRAFYFIWLCCLHDINQDFEELVEPPVPHGLADFPESAKCILSLFELDPLMIEAASEGIPDFNLDEIKSTMERNWISSLSPNQLTEIIRLLLSGDPVDLRNSLLSEMRSQLPAIAWPTSNLQRSAETLMDLVKTVRDKVVQQKRIKAAAKAKRDAEKAEKERQSRMVAIKAAPDEWLKKTSKLVEERGTENYREAASILADLREAIGGAEGEKIARKHAAHLTKKHPTLSMLKSSLRKCRLID
ncbi:MAG: hypothetical protein ACK5YR_08520 [Pirellula sp.]|jgi:hypothetical protein